MAWADAAAQPTARAGTGFNMTAIGPAENSTGVTAAPAFWWNNSTTWSTLGLSNTKLFGPTFAGYPAAHPRAGGPGTEHGLLHERDSFVTASSVSYADPYLSGRAPELEMFNFGFERGLTQNMTLAVNYMGNESHFIINSGSTGGNARGQWTNEIEPGVPCRPAPLAGTAGGPLLNLAGDGGEHRQSHGRFTQRKRTRVLCHRGGSEQTATIAQMLVAFPQYSGVSDTWGNVGNFAYHSLQITLDERMSNGLTFNFNYTYAKNVGDDGTYRTGFYVPAAAISHGTQSWGQDRMDRSLTVISIPQTLHAYGVYQLPFGKGHIGNNSFLVRQLAGGWQFSSIFTFSSGTPIAATLSGTTAGTTSSATYVGQGQAMPDMNSSYGGTPRINGSWGKGPNGFQAASLGKVQYIDPAAFAVPQNVSTTGTAQYLIGNAPRTAPYGLRNPHTWDWDTGVRRTFPIHEGLSFQFEADCLNTWNNVVFGSPSASWSSGSTSFGSITGISNSPRDFQFAGHLNF